MPSSKISQSETILIDLIHDLRQSLGNIETSLYCIGRIADPAQTRARGHLRAIEQQVVRAAGLLSEACAELARLRAQRTRPAPAYALSNPSSALAD